MNELLIQIFSELIKINQYLSETSNDSTFKIQNEFRIRSLKTGLRVIKNFPTSILSVSQLNNISGVGKGIKDRIDEILKTKKLKELDQLCLTIDCKKLNKKDTIKDQLLSVIGVGESLANRLIKDYKIETIKQFFDLVSTNSERIKKIKVSNTIKLGIKYYNKLKLNIPRQEITKTLDFLLKEISILDDTIIIQICGSYRRQKLTSSDIDLLVTTPTILTENLEEEKLVIQKIVKKLHDSRFLIDDLTSDSTNKYMGFCQDPKQNKKPVRRIDIRFIPFLSWYPALLYFTGSKEFNQILRSKAKKLGYKLNEYGLYKGNKNIYVESEEEIFQILGEKYLEPQERNY